MVRKCTKRLSLAVMALIILLLGASSLAQAYPALEAETVVSAYGAAADPTGNPIGGGTGYTHYYGASNPNAITVTTASALSSALASAT